MAINIPYLQPTLSWLGATVAGWPTIDMGVDGIWYYSPVQDMGVDNEANLWEVSATYTITNPTIMVGWSSTPGNSLSSERTISATGTSASTIKTNSSRRYFIVYFRDDAIVGLTTLGVTHFKGEGSTLNHFEGFHNFDGEDLGYYIMYPKDYDSTELPPSGFENGYPLILYLSGDGDPVISPTTYTKYIWLAEQMDTYSCFGLSVSRGYNSPSGMGYSRPTSSLWWNNNATDRHKLPGRPLNPYHNGSYYTFLEGGFSDTGYRELIQSLLDDPDYLIDEDRIYLVGFSGGGREAYVWGTGGLRNIIAAIICEDGSAFRTPIRSNINNEVDSLATRQWRSNQEAYRTLHIPIYFAVCTVDEEATLAVHKIRHEQCGTTATNDIVNYNRWSHCALTFTEDETFIGDGGILRFDFDGTIVDVTLVNGTEYNYISFRSLVNSTGADSDIGSSYNYNYFDEEWQVYVTHGRNYSATNNVINITVTNLSTISKLDAANWDIYQGTGSYEFGDSSATISYGYAPANTAAVTNACHVYSLTVGQNAKSWLFNQTKQTVADPYLGGNYRYNHMTETDPGNYNSIDDNGNYLSTVNSDGSENFTVIDDWINWVGHEAHDVGHAGFHLEVYPGNYDIIVSSVGGVRDVIEDADDESHIFKIFANENGFHGGKIISNPSNINVVSVSTAMTIEGMTINDSLYVDPDMIMTKCLIFGEVTMLGSCTFENNIIYSPSSLAIHAHSLADSIININNNTLIGGMEIECGKIWFGGAVIILHLSGSISNNLLISANGTDDDQALNFINPKHQHAHIFPTYKHVVTIDINNNFMDKVPLVGDGLIEGVDYIAPRNTVYIDDDTSNIFVTPTSDFNIVPNSPTINAGAALGSSVDAVYTTRPYGLLDVGGIEYPFPSTSAMEVLFSVTQGTTTKSVILQMIDALSTIISVNFYINDSLVGNTTMVSSVARLEITLENGTYSTTAKPFSLYATGEESNSINFTISDSGFAKIYTPCPTPTPSTPEKISPAKSKFPACPDHDDTIIKDGSAYRYDATINAWILIGI